MNLTKKQVQVLLDAEMDSKVREKLIKTDPDLALYLLDKAFMDSLRSTGKVY